MISYFRALSTYLLTSLRSDQLQRERSQDCFRLCGCPRRRQLRVRMVPRQQRGRDHCCRKCCVRTPWRTSANQQTVSQGACPGYVVRGIHCHICISVTHETPVFIAPRSSNGEGAVWTKLAHEGLSGGVWAVDKLIANKVSVLCICVHLPPSARLTRMNTVSREGTV